MFSIALDLVSVFHRRFALYCYSALTRVFSPLSFLFLYNLQENVYILFLIASGFIISANSALRCVCVALLFALVCSQPKLPRRHSMSFAIIANHCRLLFWHFPEFWLDFLSQCILIVSHANGVHFRRYFRYWLFGKWPNFIFFIWYGI